MPIPEDYKYAHPKRAEREWPGAAIPPGWLPVDITSGVPVIRWANVGVAPLTEPFFLQTINKHRAGGHFGSECETEISILEIGASELPAAPPSGVICHMTRCGSTLLANAFRTALEATVLSEAAAVGRVIGWIGSPSRYWAAVGSRLIGPLASVFAHYQGPAQCASLLNAETMAFTRCEHYVLYGLACRLSS